MKSRSRMRRQGMEDVKGKIAPARDQVPKQPEKLSKTQLREQTEAAFRVWWEKKPDRQRQNRAWAALTHRRDLHRLTLVRRENTAKDYAN
jgi:hypothetical protein